MKNNELYHFGINGQKWGVRRYQNEDGSRTEEGKIHYGYKFVRSGDGETAKTRKQIRLEKREARRAKREEKKAKKEAIKQEKREAEKKRAIESGTADEVLKYVKELTVEQKQAAARRLQADSQLLSIANQEAERNARIAAQNSKWNKAKKVTQRISEAGRMVDDLSKVYNSTAKVLNAFGDNHFPLIGEKSNKKTRSMELGEQLVKEMADFSYNDWKQYDKKYFEQYEEMSDKISILSKAEKLASGQSGKKK